MALRIITLIRHGRYNQIYELDALGGSLTRTGELQAALVGQRLKEFPPSAIYASPLRRAQETAVIVAKVLELPVETVPELAEVIPVIPPDDETRMQKYLADRDEDDLLEEQARADAAYARFFRPPLEEEEHIALVCHGNLIRYFACRAMGAPVERWTSMETFHASITRCWVEPDGRTRLVSLNDFGHLPFNLVRYQEAEPGAE
jgi:serine/threonine-protein phosphatase PGAM5